MSDKHFKEQQASSTPNDEEVVEKKKTNLQSEDENKTDKQGKDAKVSDGLSELQKKYDELNDSHLRLRAEFDNYRKRTLREKSELIKNGGEGALTHLLPVVDDLQRALDNIHKATDMNAVAEGVDLIYNKFVAYLNSQGVKAIEVIGKPFNLESSEAIATIPAPQPELKGKVLDCVQTGYTLNDKVIRHAKVVVGE
ncbi:MAG TPA: nucleotide exchange factor GrpE [Parabacteroides sp.]|nr:nucleotide exchange factor GrpE [Parabacteroides sp.]